MEFKFCPFCGNRLQSILKGRRNRMHCNPCGWTHYRNPTVGVAVIVLKDKELLLVKRNASYKGMWCIPCGHVEFDEDVQAAAAREFKEETGLDVTPISTIRNIRQWGFGLRAKLSAVRYRQAPMPVTQNISRWIIYRKTWRFPRICWCAKSLDLHCPLPVDSIRRLPQI